MSVSLRQAVESDAEAAARLMRRSIRELCTADHHCDPMAVRPWLANKRADIFREWLGRPENIILVATGESGELTGVGGARRDSGITLNYVAPEARFIGVSTALLAVLERRLAEIGHGTIHLTSTQTAHRFYLGRGYRDFGPPENAFGGMQAFPMSKQVGARQID